MLIPASLTQSYGFVLDRVRDMAVASAGQLIMSLADQPQPVFRQAMLDLAPEAFGPYGELVSASAATFYEEARAVQEFRGSFDAETLPLDTGRLYALVGAGTAPAMFEQGAAAMWSFIGGAIVSALSEHASDTIIGNAGLDDRNTVYYQRVPKAGCCAFCGMLASRSAAYTSKAAAESVVGRGVPVEKTRGRRGGQGKGIRPRGTRRLGDLYHDHCRCEGVPVKAGNSVQLQAQADDYYDKYRVAADKVGAGQLWIPAERNADGSRITKGHWIDAERNTRTNDQKQAQILAFMRAELGVK